MSTKLMSPEERSEGTENPGARSEPILEPSPTTVASAPPKPSDGKPSASQPTLNAESTADLLARLQDILSLWTGSDNKIIGNYVMTAFPIPTGMKIDKVMTADGRKAFAVDGVPVVNVEKS